MANYALPNIPKSIMDEHIRELTEYKYADMSSILSGTGVLTPPSIPQQDGTFPSDPDHMRRMICMRLHVSENPSFKHGPFFDLHPVKLNDDKVSVFVVTKDTRQPTLLEDAWSMFPSDQLIAQLRLLALS